MSFSWTCACNMLPSSNPGDYATTLLRNRIDTKLPYRRIFALIIANPRYLKVPVAYDHPTGAVIWVKLDAETERSVVRASKHGKVGRRA